MGYLITFEANDGAGKQTQAELLYKYMLDKGEKVMKISFPDYESESSSLVKMYLRGDFGKKADDVTPYVASVFFACDRYASFNTKWKEFYDSGGIVISDRYVSSNMTHQALKIKDEKHREEFMKWLHNFEYNLMGLPVPDVTFYLDVPPFISKKIILDRKNKIDNSDKKDVHESDSNHIDNAYKIAQLMIKKENWKRIKCFKNGVYLSVEDIHNIIVSELNI